jgi:hypothetical protein
MIARRLVLAAAPALAALVLGCVPHLPAGIALGGLLALPLLLAGAALASVQSSSLKVNALCGAAAPLVRVGGAGLLALTVLHDARVTAILATLAICLFVAVAMDVVARVRELKAALAAGRAAAAAQGARAHA